MSSPWGFALTEIDLPEFELPRDKPAVPAATYVSRVEATYAAMAERGLDALVVYGDREHFANTQYLTGFDPRYEESLIILVPGRRPRILVGNESVAYASGTPYPIDVVRFSKFSLNGQPDPDDLALSDLLADAGLGRTTTPTVGIAGWKYFGGAGTDGWMDVPHFIVVEVAARAQSVQNASGLFVKPGEGLRLHNDVDQIAYFEFAASHASTAVRRLIDGIRPGMTELEASAGFQPIMLPFNYHPTMLGGYENARYGVASPGSRVLEVGDPVCAGLGYWGSNTARAGFLVEDAGQLPDGVTDYVEKLVTPYYATAAAWLETIRIGLTAGELYEVTASRIGDPFYNVFLNPGHYIHLDEWPASPVAPGSQVVFGSGDALQLDIIPGTGTEYHSSQIEDGIVLADAGLRAELAGKYPAAWERIQQRRAMLQDTFGITVHEEVLPMSNTIGYLPPFWLSPNLAMARV
ncbi:Xaa-Pro aminopeptidase [Rathayibacter oskolensis]|uniref:Xaa-Pro aminopeptidase n=1 Tax=Rathayibacter oskolensis TaxID=1891671 RepID=A0A1X7PIH0_9MICO|nr:aminopeptidase P family N-terminal domain-containing protein [Rathayibacter oskolensis]SMH50421.1 Xaa-Pro aminopeptidase [Rathayibacter oskolensis]